MIVIAEILDTDILIEKDGDQVLWFSTIGEARQYAEANLDYDDWVLLQEISFGG